MKKNTIFLFALSPLIPCASRFAYGIVLSFALLWLFLSGLLFRKFIKKIIPSDPSPYIELVCLVSSATLFFLIVQGIVPVLSVSLGFYFYITAFSYFLLKGLDYFTLQPKSLFPIFPFLVFLLLFSLIREILGFGTISLPVPTGIVELTVLPYFQLYGMGFWGTAGGALILLGMLSWLVQVMVRRTSLFIRNI